jgi:hypothetical protein
MLGATNYVDPASDKNLIVHRLVHQIEDEHRGHDSIHLITGFGLDPISAKRAGATFPETAIDLQAQKRLPDNQRNLNGVLIENINDGVWEAMRSVFDVGSIADSLPPDLQRYGRKVIDDLDKRTGYGIGQPGVDPKSDFGRQVRELGDMGRREADPDTPGREVYYPNENTVGAHHKQFAKMLKANPAALEEMVLNLRSYVKYAATVEKSMVETGRPPDLPPLEIVVSPETTRALMTTALTGLRQLQQAYPNSPAVPELIKYYESVLKTGEDGNPKLVQVPGMPVPT